MNLNIKGLQSTIQVLVKENASTILTAGGVVGTTLVGITSFKAGIKANDLIRDAELARIHEQGVEDSITNGTMGLAKGEQIKLAWPTAIAPGVLWALTVGSVIGANVVNARRAAALMAAYGYAQGNLEEYKAKVAEKLTGPKTQAVQDEIAQDRITKNPPGNEIIVLAGGDVLFHDMLTGRYFRSTVEQVQKAAQEINNELAGSSYASLSEFYDKIGLPKTTFSDTVGWTTLEQDMPLELKLSTTMTPDQKPCITVDFNIMPKPEYARQF